MKKLIKQNKFLIRILMGISRIFGYNKYKIKGKNRLKIDGFLRRGKVFIKGNGNSIVATKPEHISNFTCYIYGNNNKVIIEEGCIIKNLHICIEEDDNEVIIKKNSILCGKTDMYCLEKSKIIVGESCLFSSNLYFTTSDRHSILNEEGKRTNRPESIEIGNHVWLGYGVTILKGVTIAPNSIVGGGSVVTKKFTQPNVTIAGNPAKIVKENINWDKARLPIE